MSVPNPLPPPATVKRREEETAPREEESPAKKRKRGAGSDQFSRRGRAHGRSPRRTGIINYQLLLFIIIHLLSKLGYSPVRSFQNFSIVKVIQ